MLVFLAILHAFLLGVIVETIYLIFAEPGVDDHATVRTLRRNDGTAIAFVLVQAKSLPSHVRS